jgi:predicted nucleic acid-binding Zn ribbon protein
MTTATNVKTCQACGKAVRGRTDKKFCDDYCRNNFNNQMKGDDNNLVRNINNALRRNRRILAEMLPNGEEMGKASRDRLLQLGFNFTYLTHTYVNRKGNVYSFCYDHGYLPLENNLFLLVRRKSE